MEIIEPASTCSPQRVTTRVQTSRQFLTTGVDYAGAISLRLWPPRSKTIKRCYIAIFVCIVTKAVHIEVVTSLSTETFLAALRRFIARRGKPRTICSGNGTNFQGAANELHAIYKMLQSTSQMATVQDCFASEEWEWKFNPTHWLHSQEYGKQLWNPWRIICKTLGSQVATYE